MKKSTHSLGGFINQIDRLNTLGGGIAMTQVQLSETPEAYVMRLKTPSIGAEAYRLVVNKNQLLVSTVLPQPDGDATTTPDNTIVPAFFQSFPIPDWVDKTQIEASFEEGELRVVAPFKPRTDESPFQIDIQEN